MAFCRAGELQQPSRKYMDFHRISNETSVAFKPTRWFQWNWSMTRFKLVATSYVVSYTKIFLKHDLKSNWSCNFISLSCTVGSVTWGRFDCCCIAVLWSQVVRLMLVLTFEILKYKLFYSSIATITLRQNVID